MKSVLSAWAIAGTVLCAAPAFANEQQQAQQTQQAQQEQQEQGGQAEQPGMRQVKGTVLQQKEVTVRGANRRHQVVLLETQGGRREVVDLGPTSRGAPQVKKGQQLEASGQAGRVGDRSVLFARNATIAGKQVQINRPERQLMGQGMAREVTGQVVRHKSVAVPGSDTANMVVLLRVPDEGFATVDLGPENALQEAGVREGLRLSVRARPVVLADRIVLFADQLTAGGKTTPINRQQAPATGGAGREPQDRQER